MRKAEIYQQEALAGILEELHGGHWRFRYADGYAGEPVSLTLPLAQLVHEFDRFPPVFEGLLPEGIQLEALLRRYKLDHADLFGQLIVVGQDLVGSLTVREVE
jgi:serine/threonine-protein kinase HipA